MLGNPTVFQNFTDSTENQHVVLLVLQNVKSKISGKSDQNWSCNSSALLGWRATKFGWPAVFGWLNLFLACCNFSFGLIFLKFWILDSEVVIKIHADYRVFHVSLTFLIWLKMTLKCIVDTKARHFYNPEDPPFDMKHQLKSADSLPVVKIDLRTKVYFHSFFFHFYRI